MPRHKRGQSGQSFIEYVLMVGFGAVLAIEVANFFNTILREGINGLERNVQLETRTGEGFQGR